jgi:hypothetical protein
MKKQFVTVLAIFFIGWSSVLVITESSKFATFCEERRWVTYQE